MNTSLNHLPRERQRQLEMIKKIIIKAIRPEKIVLFGVYSNPAQAARYDQQIPGLGAFDLLVITSREESRSDYEIQDIIENRCRGHAAVTILVHDIDYVNRRMMEGQYFFATIAHSAILLYDTGDIPFPKITPPDLTHVRKQAERDFERWGLQARAFFQSAVFNQQRREWRVAIFLLHQAAEQMYQAILLVFNGYKPTTHNLDKLRRYTNRFSIELALLFSREKEGEDHLFRLLLSGYVDARYKEDYTIGEEDIKRLTALVGRLLDIAERVCKDQFLVLNP